MNPILKVEGLSIEISGDSGAPQSLLKSISFNLYSGKTLAMVGQSGSGKTLTALSLIRLLPEGISCAADKAIFENKAGVKTDLLKASRKELSFIRGREIGYVPQDPFSAFNPVLTIGKQLTEAIRISDDMTDGNAKTIALDLLREVSFTKPENIFNAYPHELSGGEKQRAMIAMAISAKPAILIADEPAASLDSFSQLAIIKLLKDLQQAHQLSLLVISHDLDFLENFADEVIILNNGCIVEEGSLQYILQHPKSQFTKGLIACRPQPGKRNQKLPEISDFMISSETSGADRFYSKKIKSADSPNKMIAAEAPDKNPLISINDLCVTFNRSEGFFSGEQSQIKALQHVSLDIFKGEILGVSGESGSGKSTLGRAILQLIKPDSGEIFFKNISLSKLEGKELTKRRKDLQMVFQNPFSSLNPLKTLGESVAEPLKVWETKLSSNTIKSKVAEVLLQVGLNETFYTRFPHEISGGELQRISIARALVLKPEFIVFDEAVSLLDVYVQAQIINLIQELRTANNLTIFFISHDMNLLKYMADRIILLNNGSINQTLIYA